MRAIELLRAGRNEELWQMCCGYLKLDIDQFMTIQHRLLLEQISWLRGCRLGKKILLGFPQTVDEFREQVRLTGYEDYCPELSEKREDALPIKPAYWVHTSGRSGEYPCKWIPISPGYSRELSSIMYGLGMLSCGKGWGDVSNLKNRPNIVYAVAPRPYMSGTLAEITCEQTPINYLPSLEESGALGFEDRIKYGFNQALNQGLDCFFGLSLVLVAVGDKFQEASNQSQILPLLAHPRALLRLTRGMAKSRLEHRRMLPRDLWSVKGIISSGLDSSVYKDKIMKLWGRYPLDVYASTEGGIIATQTWDYGGMTFVPSLNFFEFIPENEHFKWQLDHSYQPKTVLLDEVKAGESYEIVITNLHGGALARYRIGDIVRITALKNEQLGINIPQMAFDRRADDLMDFGVVRLTEKVLWQAIEKSEIPYEDWTAMKEPEGLSLRLFIETKDGYQARASEIEKAVYQQIINIDHTNEIHEGVIDMVNFKVKVTLLSRGSFARYIAYRQNEGADLAHLKPPHVNPSEKVLSLLLAGRPQPTLTETTGKEKIPA